ncbi:MAG: MerR family transcriptional regulator [candidate division Zixibacteria bacterium]|nr:MerR family transcriptional regulator [candidate division Zixibacteria bacterium]
MKTLHPIRFVAKQTGLSVHLIRAWERRYNAVNPERTESNRRLYSDEDIYRLKLLGEASRRGESISQVAGLTTEALEELLGWDRSTSATADSNNVEFDKMEPIDYLDTALDAIRRLDQVKLDSILAEAAISTSINKLISGIIIPLLLKVGDLWAQGEIKVVHEHLVSAAFRSFLGNLLNSQASNPESTALLAATPSNCYHEFGALAAALTAATLGWSPIYLGANLPVEDIANAVREKNVRVVALSVVYTNSISNTIMELKKLRRYLKDDVIIIVGGEALNGYQENLDSIGIVYESDFARMRKLLSSLNGA